MLEACLDIRAISTHLITSPFPKVYSNQNYLHTKCNNNSTRKEGNILFIDALNTFYLRLYGVRHMVKDHADSERGNPLPPHRVQEELFYMHHHTDRIIHTTAFVTPVVEHWLEREIAQWVHPMKDRSDDPSHHERTLLPRSYISLHGMLVACLNIRAISTHLITSPYSNHNYLQTKCNNNSTMPFHPGNPFAKSLLCSWSEM